MEPDPSLSVGYLILFISQRTNLTEIHLRLTRWNGQQNEDSKHEKERLFELFKKLIQERAPQILDEMEPNEMQEAMQTVHNFLRAIVEVCPRGQCVDKVGVWRATLEASLEAFGV